MSDRSFSQTNQRSKISGIKDNHDLRRPILTYGTLQDIVTESRQYAIQRYGDGSLLQVELERVYLTLIDRIEERQSTSQELLDLLIRLEERNIEWWNTNFSDEISYVEDGEENYPAHLVTLTFGLQVTRQQPVQQQPLPALDPQLTPQQIDPSPSPAGTVTASSKQSRLHNTRPKPQKERSNYGKLSDAPSSNLDFPDGNLTAAEIMAFLPQWTKSWDVIERFISNGGRTGTLTTMVNTFRDMAKGNVSNNSLLRMMQGSVKRNPDPRYKQWNVGKHRPPPGWDHTNISTLGFRPPRVTHPNKCHSNGKSRTNQKQSGIQFKDLANGVKSWPMGDDILDLSRCIDYHLLHPKENWLFPDDFRRLTRKLGGPSAVRPENHDGAVFDRWKNGNAQTQARHGTPVGHTQVQDSTQSVNARVQPHIVTRKTAMEPSFSAQQGQAMHIPAYHPFSDQDSSIEAPGQMRGPDFAFMDMLEHAQLDLPDSLRIIAYASPRTSITPQKKRKRGDEKLMNDNILVDHMTAGRFRKRPRLDGVDWTQVTALSHKQAGKRKRNDSDSPSQSFQSDFEISRSPSKRPRIDESLIDPQLLTWVPNAWQQEAPGTCTIPTPPHVPNLLELFPVGTEDSSGTPITINMLDGFGFHDPNFDPSGFQYLHSIPLPPIDDNSLFAENIRFAHLHPELLLSTDPYHRSWIETLGKRLDETHDFHY
jgi:hypothetical protein